MCVWCYEKLCDWSNEGFCGRRVKRLKVQVILCFIVLWVSTLFFFLSLFLFDSAWSFSSQRLSLVSDFFFLQNCFFLVPTLLHPTSALTRIGVGGPPRIVLKNRAGPVKSAREVGPQIYFDWSRVENILKEPYHLFSHLDCCFRLAPPEIYLPGPVERTLGPFFFSVFILAYEILNLLGAQSDWLNGFGWVVRTSSARRLQVNFLPMAVYGPLWLTI